MIGVKVHLHCHCYFVLQQCAPQSTKHMLLDMYSLMAIMSRKVVQRPYPWPMCSHRSFADKWDELLRPPKLADSVGMTCLKAKYWLVFPVVDAVPTSPSIVGPAHRLLTPPNVYCEG